MTSRIFPASSAIFSTLAAAFAYAITTLIPAAWMLGVYYALTGAAVVFVVGWLAESITLMVEMIQTVRNDLQRERAITEDRNLLLAEQMRHMSGEQLAVYRDMVSTQFDPYDPASVVLPGFALLTKAFAVNFFALCGDKPNLKPQRDYGDGRSDRARDQCVELTDWLVVEGFARRAGFNSPAQWMAKDSAEKAMKWLKLREAE